MINHDDIMGITTKNNLTETIKENEQMKKLFTYSILRKPEFRNKLIILDASIGKEYKRFLMSVKRIYGIILLSNWNLKKKRQ